MKQMKRVISLVLSFALLSGYIPAPVHAEDLSQQGLCEHHQEHIGCSYTPAVEAAECGHQHDGTCYVQEENCIHVHDGCGAEDVPCEHICSEDTGCITVTLNCQHEHDNECGYAEARDAVACDYVCAECSTQEEEIPCDGTLNCAADEHSEECEKKAADDLAAEQEATQKAAEEHTTVDQAAADASETVIGTCGENLTWVFDAATGKLMISGSGEMDEYIHSGSSINTPWYVYRDQIKKVEIESGVTSIGECAFANCDNIISVLIPDSVTYINWGAFLDCSSLVSVNLGSGVTDIDGFSFGNCTSLESIIIGDNVKIIHEAAFNECTALTNITLPDGLEEIWEQAFYGCSSIISIDIPSSVHAIKTNAFSSCDSLKVINYNGTKSQWYTIADQTNWEENNNFSINYLAEEVLEYTLNADGKSYSVVGIGTCYDSIVIPSKYEGLPVTCIREQAFEGCTSLESIIISDSVTYVEWGAFLECASLTSVQIGNGVTDIGGFSFGSCTSLESIVIGDNVKIIHEAAFSGCTALTSITLPDGLEEIWEVAFEKCNNLTEITFEGSAPSIQTGAFYDVVATAYYPANNSTWTSDVMQNYGGTITWVPYTTEHTHEYGDDYTCACGAIGGICGDNLTWTLDEDGILTISGSGDMTASPWSNYRDSITNVIIEGGVTSIGYQAFNSCSNLAEIDIPDSVTRIASGAFSSCTALKRIYIPSSVISLDSSFWGVSNNMVIYCETSSVPAGWSQEWNSNGYANETVTTHYGYTKDEYSWWSTIRKNEFYYNLEIPDSITRIPDHALSGYHVIRISIPDSVTSIGKNAFKNCTGLQSIYIPGSVTTISAEEPHESPFYGCSSNLLIYCEEETVSSNWEGCWPYYSDEDALRYVWSCTREEYDFWSLLSKSAGDVVIPDYVTFIPEYAFADNPYLTSIIIPDSVTIIGINAFKNCTALRRIYIPESVETISASDYEESPFYGCNTHLTIYCESSSVPDGWDNYWDCYSNAVLYAVYEVTPEEFAFWNTVALETTEITIPDFITRIPAQAFLDCTNLTDVTLHNAVTSIEPRAFANCYNLKTIWLPDSVWDISASYFSRSPFYNCSSDLIIYCETAYEKGGWGSHWNYCANNSQLKVIYQCGAEDYSCWKTIGRNDAEIVIADGISRIPENMFSSYNLLTAITVPASVVSIGNDAFTGCYNLTDIYFGGTWTQWNDVVIGTNNSCLQDATVHYGVSPTSGTFGENLKWKYDAASTTLTISGIGAMPDYEHGDQPWGQWLGSISQIIIEDGVTALGDNAFYTIVDVDASIPESVTAIKDAFQYIHNVYFTFGGTMRQWAKLDDGSNGSANCADGTVLACGSSGYTDSSGEWIVTGTWYLENNGTLYVDGGGKQMDDSELSLFANAVTSMVIWDGTTEVAGWSYGLYYLQEITVPGTLKKLDLRSSLWLNKINIEDLAAWCELDCAYYLGGELYLDGNRISHLVIPDTVTKIGRYALSHKSSIRSVVIPESVTEIADYAFAQSWNIDCIRFKGNAPSIGDNAFMDISTTIYYPAEDSSWEWITQNTYGANEIKWYDTNNVQGSCWWNCTWSLRDGKLTVTGDGHTDSYSPDNPAPWAILEDLIQEIFVDHTVYGIGSNSFSDLTQLKRVVIGDNIGWIRSGAFSGCAALTEVIFLGDDPYEVSDDAFSGVTATVHYPAGWYWTEDDLQNYGGNLTWIEDGVELRRLTLYGDRFTHAVGQTIYVGTDISPWNASWDFEFTVSDPDILEIISQDNRSCTVKALAAGTASVTVTDSLSGLEAVREITVIEPQSISCSYTEKISVPEEDSIRYYSFTPQEDGWYCFSTDTIECMENGDWYGNWIDVMENDQYVEAIYRTDENKCMMFAELNADVAYQVFVSFNWSAYAQTSTFSLEKVSASDVFPDDPGTLPEEPEFGFYTDSIVEDFLPGEISSRHLSLNNNELEEVIWASSDPAIIEIEESYSDYCWYKILNPGTATITASCNGKSDAVTITATAIDILELSVSETLTSDEGYIYESLGFMAPETGRYVFTVSYDSYDSMNIQFNSWSSDDNISYSYGTNYHAISRDMYAGEVCRFYVNGSGSSCSVRVSNAASRPLSMEIVQLSDYPGTVSFGTGFNPRNSSDRIVKWEINDLTIAGESSNPNYNSSHYANKVYYNIYKDGKLTVTATSESGLKASLTVDVRAYACQNGHTYGEWVPVLDENGAETGSECRECESCGEYQQRRMPPLDETAENRVVVDASELAGYSTVWIDGAEYTLSKHGDKCYVDLPDSNARTMVIYTYNSSLQNRYPVGMKVWTLENTDGTYTATRQESFDDILQYSGMSIRVTGKKGIRMITSIESAKKNALTSDGLAGYTLKEYGTVIAWASQISETKPLILGVSYVKSNYAYKKGIADPVFAYSGDLMQYTNVLVNFSNEQCKNDIAMRSYMILEDEKGEELTLYGGIVNRSIGYIAYQNRDVFEPQTSEYNYIWNIIHYVYGDVYDDEFIHAWTPSAK